MNELERLMREATPLPWYFHDLREQKEWEGEQSYSISVGLSFVDDARYYPSAPSFADAALIVAAVNALPELLAKVKRLEEALTTIANPATYSHSLPSCCQHTFDDTCELFSDIARAALNQEAKL